MEERIETLLAEINSKVSTIKEMLSLGLQRKHYDYENINKQGAPLVRMWIFWYAIILHGLWGISLIFGDSPYYTTGLSIFIDIFKIELVSGTILLFIVACAILSIYWEEKVNIMICVLLLIPQQFLTVISAGAAINAIVESAFPDGVVRPRLFIFNDQVHAVLLMIFHTAAILEMYGKETVSNLLKRMIRWK